MINQKINLHLLKRIAFLNTEILNERGLLISERDKKDKFSKLSKTLENMDTLNYTISLDDYDFFEYFGFDSITVDTISGMRLDDDTSEIIDICKDALTDKKFINTYAIRRHKKRINTFKKEAKLLQGIVDSDDSFSPTADVINMRTKITDSIIATTFFESILKEGDFTTPCNVDYLYSLFDTFEISRECLNPEDLKLIIERSFDEGAAFFKDMQITVEEGCRAVSDVVTFYLNDPYLATAAAYHNHWLVITDMNREILRKGVKKYIHTVK